MICQEKTANLVPYKPTATGMTLSYWEEEGGTDIINWHVLSLMSRVLNPWINSLDEMLL